MKIYYMSDLHLEFEENRKYFFNLLKTLNTNKFKDILILAGDINYIPDLLKCLEYFNNKFKKIFMIFGNHEFYDFKSDSEILLHNTIYKYGNVSILNNNIIELDDYILCFSSMFTKIDNNSSFVLKNKVNDFNNIKFENRLITTFDINEIHNNSLTFLQKCVNDYKSKKLIIVTHHVPTCFELIQDCYKTDIANQCFNTELYNFIFDNENIKYWIYGHNHFNKNIEINKTKLITNQLGYVFNSETYKTFNINQFITI